jgi:hypothetical protein
MALHKIKAWLYANLLTSDPDDYIIRPVPERTLVVAEICNAAVLRGDSDISASAMEHAVNLFHKELVYQLCDGFSVNTGVYTAGPHVRGVAKSPQEKYDRERHTLLFEFHQGAQLRDEAENIGVDILGVADTDAIIAQVIDVKTGSINDRLTPEHVLKIAGRKIKVAGNNAVNGIYFVNQTTDERIRVDNSDLALNNPSEVIVRTPYLTAGTYRLEIITQYSPSVLLKGSKMAVFDKLLTVS